MRVLELDLFESGGALSPCNPLVSSPVIKGALTKCVGPDQTPHSNKNT